MNLWLQAYNVQKWSMQKKTSVTDFLFPAFSILG